MNQNLQEIDALAESQTAILPSLADKKTIAACDVVALRKADLAVGLVSRQQGELMFAIERGSARKCRAWGDLLVETLLDFVVWGARPTGRLSQENAAWLVAQAGEKPSAACLALLIAVLEEAVSVPDWYGPAVRARAKRAFGGDLYDKAA